ncbi:hypothetical protein [Helicobacter sp.]|nr:hypothetical protein [Helicobacter sp.]
MVCDTLLGKYKVAEALRIQLVITRSVTTNNFTTCVIEKPL